MCQDSQIPFEKSSHLVLFGRPQPCRGHAVVSCHPPCSGVVCVQVTASSLPVSPWKRHLHCTRYPASNSSARSLELRRHQPSESNFCSPVPALSPPGATFVQLDAHPQGKGKESTLKACSWKQLAPAWHLRKAGPWERGLAGSSQAAFGPASIGRPPPSQAMTYGSCIHPEGTQHVQCFYKYKDIQSIHPAHQVMKNYTTVQRGAYSERGSLPAGPGLASSPGTATGLGFAWNRRFSGFSMCIAHLNMDIIYLSPYRQMTQQPQ